MPAALLVTPSQTYGTKPLTIEGHLKNTKDLPPGAGPKAKERESFKFRSMERTETVAEGQDTVARDVTGQLLQH